MERDVSDLPDSCCALFWTVLTPSVQVVAPAFAAVADQGFLTQSHAHHQIRSKLLSRLISHGDEVFACAGKVMRAPIGWRMCYSELQTKGRFLTYWTECLACNGDVIGGKHRKVCNIALLTAEWAILHGNCRCARAQGLSTCRQWCQLLNSQQSYCIVV